KEAAKAHDEYREEVRDHFEQTSQIMSRMVDDYREMYRHMSEGAGKLANIHPEKVITPPPAPEAITAQDEADANTDTDTNAAADTAVRSEVADDRRQAPEQKAEATDTAARQDKAAAEAKQEDTASADNGRSADTADSEKERARRLSGDAPEPRRTDNTGGI